jgi:hypothetical protein
MSLIFSVYAEGRSIPSLFQRPAGLQKGNPDGKQNQANVRRGDYEIIRALKEGSVEPDGVELVVLTGHGPRERHWRMARNQEFDVCEFNVGAYLMSHDQNEPVPRFRLLASEVSAICLVHVDSGIKTPQDLIGRSGRDQLSTGRQHLAARYFGRALRRAA